MNDLYILDSQNVKKFLTAGKAVITIESEKTKKRFTYKINRKENEKEIIWFVQLMISYDYFEYIGFFKKDMVFKTSSKSAVSKNATCCIAFEYLLEHLNNIPIKLNVYHSRKCGRCGKLLTTPESIKNGLGEHCYKKIESL